LPVGRREPGRRLGERAVLHHEAPREHRGEDGGAGDDADADERQALSARTEPRPRAAERVERAAERGHSATAASRRVSPTSPAHTACAASTNARAAGEW